jgi:hypothetical protein
MSSSQSKRVIKERVKGVERIKRAAEKLELKEAKEAAGIKKSPARSRIMRERMALYESLGMPKKGSEGAKNEGRQKWMKEHKGMIVEHTTDIESLD